MLCPKCKSKFSKVVDSRKGMSETVRRRRQCLICNHRFSTGEMLYDELLEFNRSKKKLIKISKNIAITLKELE